MSSLISETDRSVILERAPQNQEGPRCSTSTVVTSASNGAIWSPDGPLSPGVSDHGRGSDRAPSGFWPWTTADLMIDTPALPAADLVRPLIGRFALDAVGMRVFATSLAHRHGTPGLPI